MFTGALFTIARTWNQPKCPLTGMDKEDVVYIYIHTHTHTMEYYSAIKKNEIMPFSVTRMDLESVIQSEVSQNGKNKYRTLTHIHGI